MELESASKNLAHRIVGTNLHAIARYRKELSLNPLFTLGRLVGIEAEAHVDDTQVTENTMR
jgi:hypothetical protein